MSNKSIYSHTPYFYVIRHIPSDKKYAGAKWASGCHPSQFMQKNGYCTSSKKIKQLIDSDGIESFEILQILTEDMCGVPVYDFETYFLIENDCAKSSDWINCHNNTIPSSNPKNFEDIMVKLYNVKKCSSLEWVKNKKKETFFNNFGCEYGYSESVNNKKKATNIEKYGSENPFSSQIIKEKIKSECLTKYGVEHHQSRPEIRAKMSASALGKIRSKTHRANISKWQIGLITAKNIDTGEIKRLSKEEYDSCLKWVGLTAQPRVYIDRQDNLVTTYQRDPRVKSKELRPYKGRP